MKKLIAVLMAIVTLAMLTGCDSWLKGDYSSVRPHQEYYEEQTKDSLEASNYTDIKNLLTEQIAAAKESCMIYVNGIEDEQLSVVMNSAIRVVTEQDPIAAYAVDEITYEIGTSTGRTAIAVSISYNRSRSEILRIKSTKDMDSALAAVVKALEDCSASVVVLVEDYIDTDLVQKIQDYVDANPDVCMEMPQVSAAVYPQSGKVRVLELTFTYQTSRDVLRSMQSYVQPVFSAAYLNVSGEEDVHTKFSRMYAFLMERNDCQVETSITPAYSLLRHGVGDSKAFATVFAAMCAGADLECHVISGTHSGEPWVWNLICEDGTYYHVDLLRSHAAGSLQLLSDEDMNGYVWDYSAYPAAEKPGQPTIKQETADTEVDTQPDETVEPEEVPEETLPEEPTEEILPAPGE